MALAQRSLTSAQDRGVWKVRFIDISVSENCLGSCAQPTRISVVIPTGSGSLGGGKSQA